MYLLIPYYTHFLSQSTMQILKDNQIILEKYLSSYRNEINAADSTLSALERQAAVIETHFPRNEVQAQSKIR